MAILYDLMCETFLEALIGASSQFNPSMGSELVLSLFIDMQKIVPCVTYVICL